MVIVKNKILPFKGFKALTIWPFIFCRSELTEVDINHEEIHGRQQLELLIIFFYLIYGIEYLIKSYKKISFEKEAYAHQDDLNYLKNRKLYAQWR